MAILTILAAMLEIVEAVAALLVMVARLLSIPFGTLVYLILYGDLVVGAIVAIGLAIVGFVKLPM